MTEEIKFLNIGLVMPIAPIDGCSTDHWLDVKRIITEAVSSMQGYSSEPKIVSEGNSSGLIHKRIVEGLYKSDIIICDVSCKNPNVMFELGMRLAFDKPTIIIKDDKTDYTFDAGVIEHLQYPRDLRYKSIVKFKELLAEKVQATYEETQQDGNKSSFLKSFGNIQVASMNEEIVSTDQYIINSLQDIQNEISLLKSNRNPVQEMAIIETGKGYTRLKSIALKSAAFFIDQETFFQKNLTVEEIENLADVVTADLRMKGFNTVNGNHVKKILLDHFIDTP
ncbi:hypothetical protein NSQ38_03375 [Paenibacillus sp. FSL R7-0313]|uniref:hypothetical protein n=1 Tax=Paenibacillus sp. FSL R7-0313 TaxID=2954532 RepID=UPI0030D9E542